LQAFFWNSFSLPPETVLEVEVLRGPGAARSLDEFSGVEFGVSHENIVMHVQMEIGREIDLIADVAAGVPGGISTDGSPGGVIKSIASTFQPEHVVLHARRYPIGRVEVAVKIKVLNVLAADDVNKPEVIMAKGK